VTQDAEKIPTSNPQQRPLSRPMMSSSASATLSTKVIPPL